MASHQEATPLVTPPPKAIATLYQLVKMGDITGILNQITQIEELDSQYLPFTTQIRQLTQSFKLKQLLDLLQQHHKIPE
jgi:hypothetical protein